MLIDNACDILHIAPFDPTKKKKKKKVVIQDPADDVDKLAEKTGSLAVTESWEGTDRDYIYDELLGRVFNILRENNPNLAGDRRRTVMRPPQDLREGTNKAVFEYFMDLCKTC